MSRIVFRTNAGQKTGLGHLVRCVHLARKLLESGAECLFVVDFVEEGIAAFLEGLDVVTLYDSAQDGLCQKTDALLFLERIKKNKNYDADWIILDDYRLGQVWEQGIQTSGHKICAIDDLLRAHHCDGLLDMRWRGEETQTCYDSLVPASARKLLGPDYVLLAPEYQKPVPIRKESEFFTIMIGLGGGGDLQLCEQIINSLLSSQAGFDKPLRLIPVLGPLSEGASAFVEQYQTNSAVSPLVGETDLYPHLCRTDFYIGAAGSVVYQLRALQIPALTFSLSESQKTDLSQLEDIGHFFHIEAWSSPETDQLPGFIHVALHNYDRIKKLGARPKVPIDGFGCSRVTEILLGDQYKGASHAVQGSAPATGEGVELSPGYRLRPVGDQDINHYLISRNLDANCQNMIGAGKIPFLHHYSWWFNTGRQSSCLTRNGTPCLYIWQEVKTFQDTDFLIGGWFVCDQATGFQDALLALNWQLEYCDAHYPALPWIAVIHRQNSYVKLMNQYVGFEEITPDHAYGSAITELFNGARHEEFYFVIRKPNVTDKNP